MIPTYGNKEKKKNTATKEVRLTKHITVNCQRKISEQGVLIPRKAIDIIVIIN